MKFIRLRSSPRIGVKHFFFLFCLSLAGSLLPSIDARAQNSNTIPIITSLLLSEEAVFAPIVPISSVSTAVIDRRGGIVQFSWTAISDGGPANKKLSAYALRCATEAINTEADWLAAQEITISTIPGLPGVMEIEQISGFQIGIPQHCILRGMNVAGLTPLTTNTTPFELAFLSQTIADSGTLGLGKQMRSVGDVNSDGKPDVLSGGDSGTAYLWFGSALPLSTEPDVVFSTTTSTFGDQIEGIGDINGDLIPDFAIAAPGATSNSGRVYVFFGRAAGVAWPAVCDIDLVTCSPDVVINGAASNLLGSSMSSTDFDGDAESDLILGAPLANLGNGSVFVIRGGTSLTTGSVYEIDPGSGTQPSGFIVSAPVGVSQFGVAVAAVGGNGVGDFRGDFMVGAPGSGSSASNLLLVKGTAYSGLGLQVLTPAAISLVDNAINGYFTSVAAAGNFNGDDKLDVLAYSPLSTDEGSVRVYFGTASGYSPASSVLIRNDLASNSDDQFGFSLGIGRHDELGNLGLIDGDALPDILLGSTQVGTDTDGAGYLFYGDGSQATEHLASEATSILQGSDGIRYVAFIGDINGDGYNDFAIGEPSAVSGAGRISIFY